MSAVPVVVRPIVRTANLGRDMVRERAAGHAPSTLRGLATGVLCMLLLAACAKSSAPKGSSGSTKALLTAGLHAQANGELARASTDYLSVLTKEPHNTLAWYNLALIAGQTHDYAGAMRDYRKAIDSNARYVPALYNLAILETPGNPRLASQLYQRCITIDPHDADAYLNLGFVERTLGKAQQGRADIAKAVALDPSLNPAAPKG